MFNPPLRPGRPKFGLWVPESVANPHFRSDPPELKNTGTYLTYSDLAKFDGKDLSMSEQGVVDRLQQLSAADCIGHIAYLSAKMDVEGPYTDPAFQHQLVTEIVGDGPLGTAMNALLDRLEPTVIFCEQQLLHLARLVILHGDPRPPDQFDHGRLYDEWVTCLIGVTDLLDAGLDVEDSDERLSWELRQCGLNHHEDQLPVTAIHYEIYRVLLPERDPLAAADLEAAFAKHTGQSMSDFFTLGVAVQARFVGGILNKHGLALKPSNYFTSTKLEDADWKPFFELVGRDQSGMRQELLDEDKRYGGTTYGSLTFERFPLFEGEPGVYMAVSMPALQRRITEGVFHLLAEGAEKEGRDRRTYTSKFGPSFQLLVEQTLRRGNDASGSAVPIIADQVYGKSRGKRRRSSDVILGYDRNPVFVEVVSGPLRIGTLTRGDRDDFAADLKRLVIDKAEQLETSIQDFMSGQLVLDGIDPTTVGRIWPVIVSSHSFPHRDTIHSEVQNCIGTAGCLQDERVGPLAILSSEELFFCEGFMQQGKTFLALISGWKSSPNAAHPFKNYLIELGGGQAPGSDHFERRFAEATAEYTKRLFGTEHSPDQILATLRSGGPS
jgi:hypothetical protein